MVLLGHFADKGHNLALDKAHDLVAENRFGGALQATLIYASTVIGFCFGGAGGGRGRGTGLGMGGGAWGYDRG